MKLTITVDDDVYAGLCRGPAEQGRRGSDNDSLPYCIWGRSIGRLSTAVLEAVDRAVRTQLSL